MKTRYITVIAVLIAAFFSATTYGLSITQQAYIKGSVGIIIKDTIQTGGRT